MDHFAVVSFHGGGDAHVGREPLADRGPALRQPPLAQPEADGVQHMIGQDRDEQMTVHPALLLMINGTQPQLRLHAPEGFFDIGEHAEDVE